MVKNDEFELNYTIIDLQKMQIIFINCYAIINLSHSINNIDKKNLLISFHSYL